MKEHYYRMPPARTRNGIPATPSYMLLGTQFITIDDARVVSIVHQKGKGKIFLHFVSPSNQALMHQRIERNVTAANPAFHPTDAMLPPDPEVLPNGLQLAFLVHTAQEIAVTLRGDEPGDPERFFTGVPSPGAEGVSPGEGGPPFNIDETPGFHVVRIGKDGSVFLFLRSWDRPYACRLHIADKDCDLIYTTLRDLVTAMDPEEWDVNVTPLDVPCVVGPQPEARSPATDTTSAATASAGTAPPRPEKTPPLPPPPPPAKPSRLGAFRERILSRLFGD